MTRPVFVQRASICALLLVALIACSSQTAPSSETTASPAPSAPSASSAAAPSASAVTSSGTWTFPAGSRVAGVDIGGRSRDTALKLVSLGLAPAQRPLPLAPDLSAATPDTPRLLPAELGLGADVPALIVQAEKLATAGEPVDVAWEGELDPAALRASLEALAPQFDQTAASDIITDEKSLTSTFTFREREGVTLDVDATAALLEPLLSDRTAAPTETVVLRTTDPQNRDLARLREVLDQHATYWKGTAGFWVQDLESGESLGINDNTVFSGASVMKVPIMIYVYSRLGKLDEQQREWMDGMIIKSDNLDANALLAAAAGGEGTEMALQGVNQMSEMMKSLGLEHTYQLIPYESGEWLIQQSKLPRGGPAQEGEAPFTAADGYVRTTPREMGELFVMLAQCAAGEGRLLETFGETLTAELCSEMVGWLQLPHDEERMVAGIPAGVMVAHKGGWIDDMQSDVGIVDGPTGRYVASIWIFRPDGYVTNEHATPSPYLGDFSHTIYTFFNPEPLPE